MRMIVSGALLFVAIASVIVATVFQGGRNDETLRFNRGAIEARELFSRDISPNEREAELKKLITFHLTIGASSRDPNVQSAAYFQAGFLLLLDYDKARKKAAGNHLATSPSSAMIQSALQHLSQAARICGDQKDRDSCFFSEIQTNLDYARFLWQETRARTESRANPQASRQGKEPPKSSDSKKSAGRSSDVENGEEPREGLPIEQGVTGSVRGAHSAEPKIEREDDFNGAGSGFRIPANKP